MTEPAWVRHAIWWHVYPLGFTGADTTGASRSPAGGLAQITDSLDYAAHLGASGLALGPIFASTSHGYDTLDHFTIDPRLGDEDDFARLVEAAHVRGLRLMLDGVFNHVGRAFPDRGWFVADPAAPSGRATFEGHEGLVTLDHDNPEVVDYVTDVMTHWLDRGADAWRLDAAYAVPDRFWAAVLPRVRAAHPEVYIVGEVIHGDYAARVVASGMDSLTQYELWKAIWSSLNDRNLFELSWALQRHNGWLETFVPMTFLGNHDVTRLASRLDDPRHLGHALVILLTVGGTPSIYYGDERGMTGVKEDRAGGDDAVRPAWTTELSGDEEAVLRLHQDLIGLRGRHSWLHRARSLTVSLANETLVYDATDGTRTLRVLLNLGDKELVATRAGGAVVGGIASMTAGSTVVPPHGWAVVDPTG
jgi:cyclomaltodextrinase / maltogenic alpha-amylase / neopullulanase